MTFKSWLNNNEVPPEPGTIPIPADHIRLYHYINNTDRIPESKLIQSIKQHGIDINKARGRQYGEDNLVWASTEKPSNGKIYVEFSVPWDDDRWALGRPHNSNDVHAMVKGGWNVAFYNSIKPEEILAIYLPWYHQYYYLKKHDMIQRVKNGEFDYLLDRHHSNEARAIEYIKNHEV